MKSLREAKRGREDDKDRDKSLIGKIDKAKGMVREAREIDCNTRDKNDVGLRKGINDLRREIERDQDEA